MNSDRTVLTEALWARVEHMRPGKATDPGVTAADNWRFLEAVLWRTRTVSPWRDLPEFFARIKEFRAVATRHDKTDESFAAAIHLVASVVSAT